MTVRRERGNAREGIFEREAALQAWEDLNALWVAIIRTEQALIVSGARSSKARDASWRLRIAAALGSDDAGALYSADLVVRHFPEARIAGSQVRRGFAGPRQLLE